MSKRWSTIPSDTCLEIPVYNLLIILCKTKFFSYVVFQSKTENDHASQISELQQQLSMKIELSKRQISNLKSENSKLNKNLSEISTKYEDLKNHFNEKLRNENLEKMQNLTQDNEKLKQNGIMRQEIFYENLTSAFSKNFVVCFFCYI